MLQLAQNIKNVISSHKYSVLRTCIFTAGHYTIDVSCTVFITGAPLHLAMTSCVVGPILNAFWYYFLDRVFFSYLIPKWKREKKEQELLSGNN